MYAGFSRFEAALAGLCRCAGKRWSLVLVGAREVGVRTWSCERAASSRCGKWGSGELRPGEVC
jgi:hypothetical protein